MHINQESDLNLSAGHFIVDGPLMHQNIKYTAYHQLYVLINKVIIKFACKLELTSNAHS